MNNDRIVFSPGDKIMRVGGASGKRQAIFSDYQGPYPKFGVVYCVEDFWKGPRFNVIMIVGFGGWRYSRNGMKIGWYAGAFRKVEEIRLCVAALQHGQQPKELQATP